MCGGLASQGSNDYFISKYDAAGVWQWTRQLGQTGRNTQGFNVAVDTVSSFVYITGITNGSLPACAGASGVCGGGVSQGTFDIFISQYTTAGAWVWTKQLGQTSRNITARAIALDPSSTPMNILIVGQTTGTLAACSGVSGACGGGSALGGWDVHLSKYNSSGTWQWTSQLGSSAGASYGYGIASDSSGNVFIAGATLADLTNCNGGATACTGSSIGSLDTHIEKYTSSGSFVWATRVGAPGGLIYPNGLATDGSGNVYVGGTTSNDLTTCSGNFANCSSPSPSSADPFVVRYSY